MDSLSSQTINLLSCRLISYNKYLRTPKQIVRLFSARCFLFTLQFLWDVRVEVL